LRNTLVTAQKMTEEIKGNAKREAELIMKEAELRAEKLLDQAHQKLAQVQAEIAELRRQRDVFGAKLRSHLKTHQDLLDAAIPDKQAPATK
jgi:cell division initiation protein